MDYLFSLYFMTFGYYQIFGILEATMTYLPTGIFNV